MLYKTQEIEEQMRSADVRPDIKMLLQLLDILAGLNPFHNPSTITVTDLISTFRAGPSCHPYGAAADVRTADWCGAFRAAVQAILTIVKTIDPKIHFRFEDKPGDSKSFTAPHLHIQYGMAADYQKKGDDHG